MAMAHQTRQPQISLTEAIHLRTSVRAYTGRPLAPEHLTMLKGIARSVPRLTDTPVHFAFVEDREKVEYILRGILGNYGKVKDAPLLTVGITGEGPHPHASLGYAMEYLILEATRHNIGTCWNSSMFDRKYVAQEVALSPGEEVLAVSPIGYPRPSGSNDFLKSLVGAKKRKYLKDIIFAEYWASGPGTLFESRPDLRRTAEAVRWAPSAVNRQPWRLILTGTSVVLTSVSKNSGLDNGIAMAHWAIAAHEEGIPGTWELNPDGDALRQLLRLPDHVELVGVYPLK